MSRQSEFSYWERMDGRYCVYAVFVEDQQGSGFVKIGLTGRLIVRLSSIQSGLPRPIGMIAVLDAGYGKSGARALEESLHEEFRNRRTFGEWFSFDFSSPEDRAAFNQGCRKVLRDHFGDEFPWWVKVSWSRLRQMAGQIMRRGKEYEESDPFPICTGELTP